MTAPTIGASAMRTRVQTWLDSFADALASRDLARVNEMFGSDPFWRDLVAFTWNIETLEGRQAIVDMLAAQLEHVAPTHFCLSGQPTVDGEITEAWFDFETTVGRGRGHVRLIGRRAWTVLTTLQELKGFEEPVGFRRIRGAEYGTDRNHLTWREIRDAEDSELGYVRDPDVVVGGGGQGGIALAARLRQLDVATIVVDRHARPGDTWRERYKSLCLHDPVWYDHLPYLPFPENWPVFSPKDKIADWLEMYARVMELDYWGDTEAHTARFDDGRWSLGVRRAGEAVTLRPSHLVFALGVSGRPNIPTFPGQDVFAGEQHHSSQHPGPDAYRGKKAVVIGSNNSAHDICAALWEADVDVTMVQRSPTCIVRSDTLMEYAFGDLYSERAVAAGIDTTTADLIFASIPYRVLARIQRDVTDRIREVDAEFYARLQKVGFDLDFGEDGSGLFLKFLRRGSGYYIDVGASELVADEKIKLAKGEVDRLTEHGVVLADGTCLEADLVVYATGYRSMIDLAAEIIGPDLAARIGRVWGLGSATAKDPGPWEGEERNMWRPTQHPALWFQGGNLHQSRHFSQFLALQLKARVEGLATPVHGLQEVHHVA